MWSGIQEKFLKVLYSSEPQCRFKIGEVVKVEDIDYPLVVTEVVESLRKSDPLVSCHWFDRSKQETKKKLIHQSRLKPFNSETEYSK